MLADGVPDTAVAPGLRVVGFVTTKDDLIAALRAFVPGLADIAVDDSGERFVLLLDMEGVPEDLVALQA